MNRLIQAKNLVNILNTKYEIIVKKYDEDESFAKDGIEGYCDVYKKQIVICDASTFEGWKNEKPEVINTFYKETLRHEIIHAFLAESGFAGASLNSDHGWADNEEMIDWFALQFPKMIKAMNEAKAL